MTNPNHPISLHLIPRMRIKRRNERPVTKHSWGVAGCCSRYDWAKKQN